MSRRGHGTSGDPGPDCVAQTAARGQHSAPKSAPKAATSGSSDSRLRVAKCFPPPGKGDVPYADCRPEVRERTPGEWVAFITETQVWKEVMRPLLARVDGERPRLRADRPHRALRAVPARGHGCTDGSAQ